MARVGDVHLPPSLVLQVARSRGVAPKEALDDLVADALLAQAAKDDHLDSDPSVVFGFDATVARLLSQHLHEGALSRGPPTPDELATVEVVHGIILRSPSLPHARGRAVAQQLWESVSKARSDADFEQRAKQVPHPGAQLVVERLSKFDASGRGEQGERFDDTFTAAAFELRAPGETTTVIESPFGWHVIRLISRVPPDAASLEARRRDLASSVFPMRVRIELNALLRDRRKRANVEVLAAADALMAGAANKP